MRMTTIVAAVALFALLLSGCAVPIDATTGQPSGSAPAGSEAVRAGDAARVGSTNSAATAATAATAQPAVTTDVQPISFVGPIEALPAGGLIGRWQIGDGR